MHIYLKNLLCVHTTFFIFYSFLLSFSFLCVSLLTASPSLLFSSTDPSFFLIDPSPICTSPTTTDPSPADPRSAANLTHFSLSSLFSAFQVCVLGCACVSALYFGLGFCFGHGFRFLFRTRFVFRLWFFCFLFLFFFTGFDGHGGVVVVQWFLWV